MTTVYSIGDLYDTVKEDNDDFMEEDQFYLKVSELVELGLLEKVVNNDEILCRSIPGIKWNNFNMIDDPVKKQIMLLLVDSPDTFFILLNTQKGKMKILSNEIKTYAYDTHFKVVSFIVVSNDRTLADQSADGIKHVFSETGLKLFQLSSDTKCTVQEISTYINAYCNPFADTLSMPVILLLANNDQLKKMRVLINGIISMASRGSCVRYSIAFDEADKTYPPFRNKPGINISEFTVHNTSAMYRAGWVSATEGALIDLEEYPECAHAHFYKNVIDPETETNYRALHTKESVIHHVKYRSSHTNNSYAIEIITNNGDHFFQPVLLNGVDHFRKTIIYSNARTEQQTSLAKWCIRLDSYAMVYNGAYGTSIKIYRPGVPVQIVKTKKRKFNEILFWCYLKFGLDNKPLFIIGNKKVDRGTGFHYPNNNPYTFVVGDPGTGHGDVIVENMEGLIWTDMILGKIKDKNIASQKGGRLAGIIAHSPQYTGSIHFWIDESTAELIRDHNCMVDQANKTSGYSAIQSINHAQEFVKSKKIPKEANYLIYKFENTVIEVCEMIQQLSGISFKYHRADTLGDFYITSLNDQSCVRSLDEVLKKRDGAYSGSGYRTSIPCYTDTSDPDTLHFVIPFIKPGIEGLITEIKEIFPPVQI